MNKKNQAVLATSFLALLMMSNATHAASTGTITFNGQLDASTCDVSVDGQGADAVVTLPTVSTADLAAPAKTAGRTSFNMALTNCTGTLKTVSAFFQAGSSVDAVTGRLKNMTGTATNVSLELLDGANSSVIKVGDQNQVANTTYIDVTKGPLVYQVQYYAEDATTAGTVSSNVVYNLQYK